MYRLQKFKGGGTNPSLDITSAVSVDSGVQQQPILENRCSSLCVLLFGMGSKIEFTVEKDFEEISGLLA